MASPKLTTEALDELNDDALATIAVEWKAEAKRFNDGAGLALFELERRMEESGATQLDTESWMGKLESKGYTHAIEDDEAFRAALVAADVDEYRLNEEVYAFPPPPSEPKRHWNMRALNELHKLGGAVAEAIDAHRRSTPNRKTLALKVKLQEARNG